MYYYFDFGILSQIVDFFEVPIGFYVAYLGYVYAFEKIRMERKIDAYSFLLQSILELKDNRKDAMKYQSFLFAVEKTKLLAPEHIRQKIGGHSHVGSNTLKHVMHRLVSAADEDAANRIAVRQLYEIHGEIHDLITRDLESLPAAQ